MSSALFHDRACVVGQVTNLSYQLREILEAAVFDEKGNRLPALKLPKGYGEKIHGYTRGSSRYFNA
jgi:hypothetical protein